MSGVLEVNFQKVDDRIEAAPFVDVSIKDSFGARESNTFLMRVDTGADISSVSLEHLMLPYCLLGRPCRIRQADGRIRRVRTYMATICIHNGDEVWSFRPQRGVIITQGRAGLLGMDILRHLSMLMMDETLILERGTDGRNTTDSAG